ncbi:hypothetical protein [Novosphingobium sp. MMS21-SN21R]|uniref:hypothetical protein n=1 Tax=Novosphingobium sp. MMS21-SN21R TaxID=2969298 RepID=UPI002883950C|nr:hypothetical protein [Novosphingobium sp. MMS21-SN21R]MDT0510257.1 hypothetical protein [Novosphingobium sp. MMS21-SN21R]
MTTQIDRYIRTETLFSMIGSVAVTVILFHVTFGMAGPVPVWGAGAFVFDCFPQAFFTGLICTILPGFITRSRAQTGGLAALEVCPSIGKGVTAFTIIRRSIAAGLVSMVVVGPGSAAVLQALGDNAIAWWPALGAKALIAAAIALAATPLGLRTMLRDLQHAGGRTAAR